MISLFIMAKNARGVIERAILSTLPHVGEFVLVANDCSDDTIKVSKDFCKSRSIDFQAVEVTRRSNPEMYILDDAETYLVGKPLANEVMTGPFTGDLILADWAAARNTGWDITTKDQTLFLDADDVVEKPGDIGWAVEAIKKSKADVVVGRYEVSRNEVTGEGAFIVYRERVARRGVTRWRHKIHEGLDLVGKNVIGASDGLLVRDMGDSLGDNTRISNRNLKILYSHARKVGWDVVDPHYLAYLVMETYRRWPDFTIEATRLYLTKATWKEQRAWVLSMAGEACEIKRRYPEALDLYEKALGEHELASACFKAARCSFFENNWEKVIAYYIRGLKAFAQASLFDNNMSLVGATKILYCSALAESGKLKQAAEVVAELQVEYPKSMALGMLAKTISQKMS